MLKIGQGVRIKDGLYKGEIGVIDYVAARDFYPPYRIKLNIGDYTWESEDNVEPLPKSWDTLAKGDVVVNRNGLSQTILSVEGDIVGVSYTDNQSWYSHALTKKELINTGYTIKNAEEEVTEFTIKEATKLLAKKLGIAVKIVS